MEQEEQHKMLLVDNYGCHVAGGKGRCLPVLGVEACLAQILFIFPAAFVSWHIDRTHVLPFLEACTVAQRNWKKSPKKFQNIFVNIEIFS